MGLEKQIVSLTNDMLWPFLKFMCLCERWGGGGQGWEGELRERSSTIHLLIPKRAKEPSWARLMSQVGNSIWAFLCWWQESNHFAHPFLYSMTHIIKRWKSGMKPRTQPKLKPIHSNIECIHFKSDFIPTAIMLHDHAYFRTLHLFSVSVGTTNIKKVCITSTTEKEPTCKAKWRHCAKKPWYSMKSHYSK